VKPRLAFMLALVSLTVLSLSAQRSGAPRVSAPRANAGRIPTPPPARSNPRAKPDIERSRDNAVNSTPHVNNDHWYGHDRPNDPHYRVGQPFEHGRFAQSGPSYRYGVLRIDREHHRFWFPGGFFFDVALWDWPLCADWCWDCGEDFVIYDDPDHPGWYLLYNIHTGAYVHVMYGGVAPTP